MVYAMFNVLSVAPGTELYDKMKQEGRVRLVDASYRNGVFPCIVYNNFTQVEMLDALFGVLEKLFSWESISERAFRLFEQGAFQRGGNDVVPFTEKFRISMKLLRRYGFSKNRVKRRMFFRLFKMARLKKLSMNDFVVFLLNMEGYQMYLEKAREYLPEVRQKVAEIDALAADGPG